MQHFTDGELQLRNKDYAAARESLTKCINELNHFSTAEENTRKLLAKAYNNRGQVEYLCVNFFEAVSDYSQALKFDSDFSVALYNRGLIHYRLGQYTLALQDLEEAQKLDPKFTDVIQAIKATKLEQSKYGDRFWPNYSKEGLLND